MIKQNLQRLPALLLTSLAVAYGFDSYYISTLAGNGRTGAAIDGSIAQYSPVQIVTGGVWASSDGFAYLSENNNYKVRTVDTSGILGTVAGGGSVVASSLAVYAATSVTMSPFGLWGDTSGLYVADYNSYLWKVSNGLATKYAGNGATTFSGNGKAATSSSMYNINNVCTDTDGNIFVSGANGYRVLKISSSIVTTFAGTGSTGASLDGGQATSATLGNVYAIASDSSSNIFISESYPRIRKVSTSGIINTFAGMGVTGTSLSGLAATSTYITKSCGIGIDLDYNVFYSDYTSSQTDNKVRVISSGIVSDIGGGGTLSLSASNYGPATAAALYPWSLFVTTSQSIFVSDVSVTVRILSITAPPTPMPSIRPSCTPTRVPSVRPTVLPTELPSFIPTTIQPSVSPSIQNFGYFISTVAGSGVRGNSNDGVVAQGSPILSAQGSVLVYDDGVLFSETDNMLVRTVDASGILGTAAGGGTISGTSASAATSISIYPTGLWGDDSGFYLGDSNYYRLWKVYNGMATLFAGKGGTGFSGNGVPATSSSIGNIWAVCGDTDGNIYTAGGSEYRVLKFSNSVGTNFAGTGTLSSSTDGGQATSTKIGDVYTLCSDSLSNIYISESYYRIRKVSTSGIITTIAGKGTTGTSSDGLPATSTFMSYCYGIWINTVYNLFYSDGTSTNKIKVVVSGYVKTVAGSGFTGSVGNYGPATSAYMNNPRALSGTTTQAIYFGETDNYDIRVLTLDRQPTPRPTISSYPSVLPTYTITSSPSCKPTVLPTTPTVIPSLIPTRSPTCKPTIGPSCLPSIGPSRGPTVRPSVSPTTATPSREPSTSPTMQPIVGYYASTLAGNGVSGYSPDGVTAQGSSLSCNGNGGVWVATDGVVSFAENTYGRVRTVDTNGILGTIAGGGSSSATSIAATSMSIYPMGVWGDESSLYIADRAYDDKVLKVTNGIATTLAGSSATATSFAGGGVPATSCSLYDITIIGGDTASNIYVDGNYRILKISNSIVTSFVGTGISSSSTSATGPATSMGVVSPLAIASDSASNVYYCEGASYRIRRITTSGIISTFAGMGSTGATLDNVAATVAYLNAYGLWVDTAYNLFFADNSMGKIRIIVSGYITTIAGGADSGDYCPATAASIKYPRGIYGSTTQSIYIYQPSTLSIRALTVNQPPSPQPTVSYNPTALPSIRPTNLPTIRPTTGAPTAPTINPTLMPTDSPVESGSASPSGQPTVAPSLIPTIEPTTKPTAAPTIEPSLGPSVMPSMQPSVIPSVPPSLRPSLSPTEQPTRLPTSLPTTRIPTSLPTTKIPSVLPTVRPSLVPTVRPSLQPSRMPTVSPSRLPTIVPSIKPTAVPTLVPTESPSVVPTCPPTELPSTFPTECPTIVPTVIPTVAPSTSPTITPSRSPTLLPTLHPTLIPTLYPTLMPTVAPSLPPSVIPSQRPTPEPSNRPSTEPSLIPSLIPTECPTLTPTREPTLSPTFVPTEVPTEVPSIAPSPLPSMIPTIRPSRDPSVRPSIRPTTMKPTRLPTELPSQIPTRFPSVKPTTFGPTINPSRFPSVRPSRQPSLTPTVLPTLTPTIQPTTMSPSVKFGVSVTGPSSLTFKIVLPWELISSSPSGWVLNDIVLTDALTNSRGTAYLHQSESITLTRSYGVDSALRSVSVVGDTNGDGFNELLIGDPFAGKVYVLFGREDGFVQLKQGFTVFGESDSDMTGWSVADAGDVNNDTLHDIIIGAPVARGVGAFYVIYGRTNDVSNVSLSSLDASVGFAVFGYRTGDYLGISVSGAADINQDGYDDVIAGAVFTTKYFAGGAVLVYGGITLSDVSISALDSNSGYMLIGASYSYTGCSVSKAGDFNGDGFDDVIIGSNPQRATLPRVSYVVYGTMTKPSTSLLSSIVTTRLPGGWIVTLLSDVGANKTAGILTIDSVSRTFTGGIVVLTNATFMAPTTSAPSIAPTSITGRPTVSPTTCCPSVIPTKKPTNKPSVRPTAPTARPIAGVIFTTEPTEAPSEEPSELPTLSPSQIPMVAPVSLPTNVPQSVTPTIISTVAPSVELTDQPTILPVAMPVLTRRPISIPSLAPTDVAPLNYENSVTVTASADLQNQLYPGMTYTVNTREQVSIYNSMGFNKYVVLPFDHALLIIQYLNVSNDCIDLTAFTSINSFSDLLITSGSVIITLPDDQVLRIMNLHPTDLNESAFLFYADAVGSSKSRNQFTTIIAGIAFGLAVIAMIAFVAVPFVQSLDVFQSKQVLPSHWLVDIPLQSVVNQEVEHAPASDFNISPNSGSSFGNPDETILEDIESTSIVEVLPALSTQKNTGTVLNSSTKRIPNAVTPVVHILETSSLQNQPGKEMPSVVSNKSSRVTPVTRRDPHATKKALELADAILKSPRRTGRTIRVSAHSSSGNRVAPAVLNAKNAT